MFPNPVRALLMTPLFALMAYGQTPEFTSPEVNADGTATFRYHAPAATAVAVQGLRGREPVAMAKDKDGIWSATVTGLPADLYSYTYSVDGAVTLDPRNRNLKKWIRSESAFEVAGTPAADFVVQDVPHGVVHRHTYASGAAGRAMSYHVYTPPGYNPMSSTRYPVVFLFHGFGDDETAWEENGRAHAIADNLIARGAMRKAVIVMPHGHPVPYPLTPDEGFWRKNDAAMEQAVLNELLPRIAREYRVSTKAKDRAIVGLSMGGGHALGIGLKHPRLFGWVGGFSSASPETDLEARFADVVAAAAKKKRTPFLWIAIGRDDFLLQRNQAFNAWLEAKQIPFTYRLTDGGHEWTLWRQYLGDFLQQIFKD